MFKINKNEVTSNKICDPILPNNVIVSWNVELSYKLNTMTFWLWLPSLCKTFIKDFS
jgi:hypothetical protein